MHVTHGGKVGRLTRCRIVGQCRDCSQSAVVLYMGQAVHRGGLRGSALGAKSRSGYVP